MAICPNCRRDSFKKRQYTNYHNSPKIKIYWACLKCGFTEEGYWTTPHELEQLALALEGDEDTDSDSDD